MTTEILPVIYQIPAALIIALILVGVSSISAFLVFRIYEIVVDSLFYEKLKDWFQYRQTIKTYRRIDKLAKEEGWVNIYGVKSFF
ncbi:MAG: hypothetical protein HYX21_02795 [Candidatus Yanofskybacteria bacterium]|nr:hypothetical protein [Candidatus Yanofskybacteria bacterium]MBI4079229.1 hypothetical protein [Candidatus Levybacteria bacterium]